MDYIKYLIIFVLFLIFKNLEAQTSNVEMVLIGPSTLNNKNRMVVNVSFLNNNEDTVNFYHPGILSSAFGGYYMKNSPRYSFGILKSDSLLFWKGNCDMTPPKQNVYLSFKNGLTLIFPKNHERLRNSTLSIPPGKFVSLDILVAITDCYQLEKHQKYKFSLTYNHPIQLNDDQIEANNNERLKFLYSASASFDFIYVGK
jgi:hypothetical protein